MTDGSSGTGRRKFLKLAGTGIVSASIAGCSGNSDGGSGGSKGSDGGSDGSDDQSGGGNSIPDFTWLMTGTIRTLDPAKSTDRPTTVLTTNFYDNLVTVNQEGQAVANVATKWTTENSGKTWVFTLRDDVTFHGGNSMTAEDVAYSMERMMEASIGYAALWQGFVEPGSTEVRDDTTVAFNTAVPYGPFLSTLVQLFIVDSNSVKDNSEGGDYGQAFLSKNVAGSGPYQLPSPLNTGDPEEIEMEAFRDYWGGWESNQFRNAQMQKAKEESTIKNLMKTGEAHMTDPVLGVDAYREMNDYDRVKVVKETHSFRSSTSLCTARSRQQTT